MKSIIKKILVTIATLVATVTLAYAGMKTENMLSWDEAYNHPALDQLATACEASF